MSTRIQLRAGNTYVLEVQGAEARAVADLQVCLAESKEDRAILAKELRTLVNRVDHRELKYAHEATAAAARERDRAQGRITTLADERDFLKGNLARARAGHDLLMSRNTALREDLAKSQRRERKLQDRIDTIKEVLR